MNLGLETEEVAREKGRDDKICLSLFAFVPQHELNRLRNFPDPKWRNPNETR